MGANYRAGCRAKSNADFIYKIEVVLEEADEAFYWLQLSKEASLVQGDDLEALLKEANELVSISMQAIKQLRKTESTILLKSNRITDFEIH